MLSRRLRVSLELRKGVDDDRFDVVLDMLEPEVLRRSAGGTL